MALTEWDEYLIHQIGETIDTVEGDDPHFMDRFAFFCHNAEGTLHLIAGLGTYPNVNVMDGLVCVRYKDIQRNIRVSRHLQADRANTEVGPLSFKVLEPHKRWSIHLGDNDYGIGCSLEFEGRAPSYLFPKLAIVAHPQSHYNQPGRYTGSITFEGQQFDVDGFPGARDRSWGIRRPGIFSSIDVYLWIQAHFSSFAVTILYLDLLGGAFRMRQGAILGNDGSVIPIVEMRHRIEFIPGSKTYNKVELMLEDANGQQKHLIVRPISLPCYLAGGGYDDRHGLDRGPFHVEGERWDLSQAADFDSFRFLHHERDAECQLDGESGVGLIESSFGQAETWQYEPTF